MSPDAAAFFPEALGAQKLNPIRVFESAIAMNLDAVL
jgi:hypothetical protein